MSKFAVVSSRVTDISMCCDIYSLWLAAERNCQNTKDVSLLSFGPLNYDGISGFLCTEYLNL